MEGEKIAKGLLMTEEENQESVESWKPRAELQDQGWLASLYDTA